MIQKKNERDLDMEMLLTQIGIQQTMGVQHKRKLGLKPSKTGIPWILFPETRKTSFHYQLSIINMVFKQETTCYQTTKNGDGLNTRVDTQA